MQNISALFGPWIIGFYALLFLLTALLYRLVPAASKRLGGQPVPLADVLRRATLGAEPIPGTTEERPRR